MKNKKLSIAEIVDSYKTKHEHGFTRAEMEALLTTKFPSVSTNKFYNELGITTCKVIDGEPVTYRGDIEQALRAVVENKKTHPLAWD